MINIQINDTQATLLREILQFHQVETMIEMVGCPCTKRRQQCIDEIKNIQSILKVLE